MSEIVCRRCGAHGDGEGIFCLTQGLCSDCVAALEAENKRLRKALKFYAEGEYSEGYPGGIHYEEDGELCLDFGEKAIEVLKEKP